MSTRRERAKAQSAQQSKQVVAAVSKQVKEHPIAKKMGDFFIDVAKLVIGGVILAGLMKQDIDYLFLFWLFPKMIHITYLINDMVILVAFAKRGTSNGRECPLNAGIANVDFIVHSSCFAKWTVLWDDLIASGKGSMESIGIKEMMAIVTYEYHKSLLFWEQ